ncbi:MAG: DUF4274 domain-containing protein [Pseudomonadota bacterium]
MTAVKHVRPGTSLESIDARASRGNGLLTSERLNDKDFWPQGIWPCFIGFPKEGEHANQILAVEFLASVYDPEGVAKYQTPEALLSEYPGARKGYVTPGSRDTSDTVYLPETESGVLPIIVFQDKTFIYTRYVYANRQQEIDTYLLKKDQEELEEKKREQVQKDAIKAAYLERSVEDILAEFRKRDSDAISSDDPTAEKALRRWVGNFSNYRNQPRRREIAQEFVEWLIAESTPDQRHIIADWNWGSADTIFQWMIRQPDTDIATIAKIIWGHEPFFYIAAIKKHMDGIKVFSYIQVYDLLLEAADRIRDGFYQPPTGHEPLGYRPLGYEPQNLMRLIRDNLANADPELVDQLIPMKI